MTTAAGARFLGFTRSELVALVCSLDDRLRDLDDAQLRRFHDADVTDPRLVLAALRREADRVLVTYLDDVTDDELDPADLAQLDALGP